MVTDKSTSSPPLSVAGIVGLTRKVWLAGLGAFALAEEGSSRLFTALVEEGEKVESHTRQATQEKVGAVKAQWENTVEELKDRATDTLDGVEQLMEDRMARVLLRLGVPTSEDVQELIERIEDINIRIKILLDKP
ncbi:MAG: phasin family protein [Candidatus Competibacteraceae bacterium]